MENSNNNKNNSLYTANEESILNNNLDIRNKVISKLTENGGKIPDNQNTLRVLDLYLTGSDMSVHKTAENRTKHQAAQNTEETLEFVAAIIRSVSNDNSKIDNSKSREIILGEEVIPLDTVIGETTMGVTDFNVKEFTGEE